MSAPIAPNGRPLAEVYRSAADRVRRAWFQGAFAATEDGREVSWDAPDAHAFCALGALFVEARPDSTHEQVALVRPLLTALVVAQEVKIYDENEDERRPFAPGDDLEACVDELDPEDTIGLWNDADERKTGMQTSGHVAGWLERVAASLEAEAGAP